MLLLVKLKMNIKGYNQTRQEWIEENGFEMFKERLGYHKDIVYRIELNENLSLEELKKEYKKKLDRFINVIKNYYGQ